MWMMIWTLWFPSSKWLFPKEVMCLPDRIRIYFTSRFITAAWSDDILQWIRNKEREYKSVGKGATGCPRKCLPREMIFSRDSPTTFTDICSSILDLITTCVVNFWGDTLYILQLIFSQHFNVSRYCHNEFLSVGCQQKRTLGTGALWTEFKVLTGWHEELLS